MTAIRRKRPTRKRQDAGTAKVFAALRVAFPDLPEDPAKVVYRYNPVAIRVRVVSPRFVGKSLAEREEMVLAALDEVPESVADDITMILMLTPREAKRPDVMSNEFDEPDQNA